MSVQLQGVSGKGLAGKTGALRDHSASHARSGKVFVKLEIRKNQTSVG